MGMNTIFFLILSLFFYPANAHAFSLTEFIKDLFTTTPAVAEHSDSSPKPFPFLSAVPNADPQAARMEGELQFVGDTALASSVGPLGNAVEAAESSISYAITTYTVRKGDTISLIAKTFGVSVPTVLWANNIPRSGVVKEGDVLVILPVSGVKHIVQKGETVASIAKKYDGDPDEIFDFNSLVPGESLAAGSTIIVPDGEVAAPVLVARPRETSPSGPNPRTSLVRGGGPDLGAFYMRPIVGGVKTQGIHGYNGVDLAAARGTPVYAAAGGAVLIARSSGWNGGYGKYVVISHSNGTQTLYSHLDSVGVSVGAAVNRGQVIGKLGSTGKSTGPHVHFEVRGAKNPF